MFILIGKTAVRLEMAVIFCLISDIDKEQIYPEFIKASKKMTLIFSHLFSIIHYDEKSYGYQNKGQNYSLWNNRGCQLRFFCQYWTIFPN